MGEFKWAENFIAEHQDKLAQSDQELIVLINATLSFHKAEYISCYRTTATHSFSNPRWEIILRNLKLKCYIELDENRSDVDKEVQSTLTFLEDHRAKLSNNLYTHSKNYCDAISHIISGNVIEFSKLVKRGSLSHRLWLNKKLEELVSNGYIGAYKPTKK